MENGSLGEVVAVDVEARSLSARLDSGERVSVGLEQYPHVALGYAVTTHKGQGATVERAFVLMGGSMQDREITYVQASRSKEETRLFTDKQEAGEHLSALVRQASQSRQKQMAHTVERTSHAPQQQQPGPAPGIGF